MNVKSVEKKEKSTVELVIEVGAEEFEAAVQKVYLKQRGKIAIPGFRKGHAPRKIIEAMYGTGVFYEDAINDVYPGAYAQAVEQEKLDAVAWPSVEVVSVGKEGLTFKAVVTVRPEVKLGQYKDLTAEKPAVTVTDEDIEGELKPYINRATRMVTVDGPAENGAPWSSTLRASWTASPLTAARARATAWSWAPTPSSPALRISWWAPRPATRRT